MIDAPWSKVTPEVWGRKKLKYVAGFVGGGTPDKSKPEFWDGDIPWVSPKDMKTNQVFDSEDHITLEGLQSSATNLVEPGAALIVVRSGILRHSIPVAVNRVRVALNQDMRAILPDDSLDVVFLAYLIMGFQTQLLSQWSKEGATVESIEYDLMASTEIPLPTLDTQKGIIAFLDRETAEIDALIVAKQRLLELLAEKRRAIVAEAVMRGLNPAVRMRPSGIDWLGDIPAHWEMKRSKWLFLERDDRSTDGSEVLLSLRMERGLVPHNDVSEKHTRPEELIGYKKTSVGQLVVNRMRAATGLIAITTQDGLVSPDYAVFRPSPDILADYYVHMFKTPLLQAVFRSESTGLGTGSQGFLRLYSENFLALWFPCPPLAEQHEIVRYISTETAKIDRLRAATEHSISLLKERRGALIAAAVTGQIDIPEAA
ncbi:type I restriction enzyme S subunit [Rhizomicrobium palustre]|uniref:Type I restriction enzyme S subunit n=1 Tax=Rhizomicrobium palustre TaxID=189966 RepID=A0A846MW75_9PROT|nr:restriction endonuclease subunit S [Rhizomicrobium palustre]NIK87603.1 type I restriction enzyme S subunit [Rhizomicrobium palustre]